MKSTDTLSDRVVSNVDLYYFTLGKCFLVKTVSLLPHHTTRSALITAGTSSSPAFLSGVSPGLSRKKEPVVD